jgi:outer membrane protein assembly factor BamB
VVVNGATRIRSHDLKTGEVIWSCGGMSVNPIPSPLRFGDAAICMSGYKSYAAVAVPLSATGEVDKVLWRYNRGTPYVASPVLVGKHLYFTEGLTNLLTVLDARTGKPVIDRERLPGVTSFYASPIYAGGRVYFVDRGGTAVVLKPGDTLEPLAVNRLGDAVDASPVAVGRQLFLRGAKYLYCIEAK